MSGEDPGWDYRLLDLSNEAELDRLGAEGWEIAATASGTAGSVRLCLKRPRPTFRERVTLDQKRHVYAAHGIPLPKEER